MKRRLLPVFVVSVFFVAVAPLQAATLYVHKGSGVDSGPCTSSGSPCQSIQYAVVSATSGDTIKVAAGTYNYAGNDGACTVETGIVCVANTQLTIIGGYSTGNWSTSNPTTNLTIIDGQSTRRGIRVTENILTTSLDMQGFTVQNCREQGAPSGSDSDTFAFGGGVLVDTATLIMSDMKFTSNQAIGGTTNSVSLDGGTAAGGAIALRNCPSGTSLTRIDFLSNTATGGNCNGAGATKGGGVGRGAGLFISESTVTANDLYFEGNQSNGGDSSNAGSGTIRGDVLGGAISIGQNSTVAITDLTAKDNHGVAGNNATNGGRAFGGAVYLEKCTSITITDADIQGNDSTGGNATHGGLGAGGGLMSMDSQQITLSRVAFINNSAIGGNGTGGNEGNIGGGGAYIEHWAAGTSNVTIENCIFGANGLVHGTGNFGAGGGGGLYLSRAVVLTMSHTTFAENYVGDYHGLAGIAIVMVDSSYGVVADLDYCIFSDHSATFLATVHVQPSSTANFDTGIFYNNSRDTNSDGVPTAGGTFTGLGTMLTASPDYVSPGSPNYDYHITNTSGAIDEASGSLMDIDIDGESRDSNPDIGADEVASSLIFSDGFESGNTSGWDSVTP